MYLNRALYLSLLIILTIAYNAKAASVQDSIPPTFTVPPQNLFISCDDALSIELSVWINSGAFGEADNGDAEINALLSVNEALNLLLQSFGSGCSNNGEVEVGFYAIDDCNNISVDTLFSRFVVEDKTAPVFAVDAQSVTTHCDIGIQDTLSSWLITYGGAITTDNCSDSIFRTHYTWQDSEGNTGFVEFGELTDISIQRETCAWSVDVSFFVKDECDNINSTSASFSIDSDTIAPTIIISLADTTILCNQSLDNIAPLFQDGCDGVVDVVYSESSTQHIDTLNCGFYDYSIERRWTATDACGNTVRDTQMVVVVDTIIPLAIYEDEIIVPCGTDLGDPENFFQVSDNCSGVEITFMDEVIVDNNCQQQIRRTWTLADVCRNTLIATQTIQIQDFDSPIFTTMPSDLTLGCDDLNIISTYRAWLANNANAQIEDNCTAIKILVRVPGDYQDTTAIINAEAPTLPMPECNGEDNKIVNQEIEIFAYDQCGNIGSAKSLFILIDTVAATIINCPKDTIYNLGSDDCLIDYLITYPAVEDNCGLDTDTIWTAVLDDNFIYTNIEDSSLNLEVGSHDIVYTTQDCGGNISSCTQFINIIDTISPIIDCKSIIDFYLEDDCTNTFIVPDIEDFSDNCFGSNNFSQTQPSLNRFINFSYDSVDSSYSAQDFPVEFKNIVTTGRIFKPQIKVEYALNIDPGSTVKIISEFGDVLMTITESQCLPNIEFLILEANQFNVWAADMDIKFTVVFEDNTGDGTSVCDTSNISPTDLRDEVSYLTITLEYSDIIPEHTISDSDQNIINEYEESSELALGTYELLYTTTDRSNNIGTCNTTINVLDTIAPVTTCRDTTITISPNDDGMYEITSEMVITSSEDNCGIPAITYEPATFSCVDAGQSIMANVTTTDESDNVSSCLSKLTIEKDSINPTFVSGLCLADTLQLFSGLTDDIVDSYFWTGPDNFTSDLSNPILTSINDDNSGKYRLEITTKQGCIFIGEADIEVSLFDSPEIFSNQTSYCSGDDVLLNSNSFTEIVDYFWYEGVSPNGILIGQTDGPSFSITPTTGEHFYYVEVRGDNCNSNPSNTITVDLKPIPVATIANPFLTLCNGDDIVLMSSSFDPDFVYEWMGPNGYISSGQTPTVINNATAINQGNYTLIIKNNNCVSDTVTAQVVIFEPAITPEINGESILCVGQSAVLSVNNITTATRYNWYNDGVLFNSTSTNNLLIPSVSINESGAWTVIIEDGLCLSDESEAFQVSVESVLNVGASNNGPICEGDAITLTTTFIPGASYQWVGPQGNTFQGREITINPVNGIYTVNLTTQSNCTATTTTEVSVRPKPIITALSNTSLPCMSGSTPISLVPSVFPIGNYSYTWTGPNNYNSNEEVAIIPNANLSDNGTYNLIVSNGDCVSDPSSNTVDISIIPQVALLQGDIMACENSNVTIEILNPVNGNANWIWTTPQGNVTTTTSSLPIDNINAQNIGQYSVIQEQNGCRSQPSTSIEVSIIDLPQVPTINGPTMICGGDQLILTTDITQGSTYLWLTPMGLISQDTPEFIIDNITTADQGNYQVYTQMGSCTSPLSSELSIEVIGQPIAPEFVTNSISICNDLNTELEVCINDYPEGYDMVQIVDAASGTILMEENSLCFDLSFLLNTNQSNIELAAVVIKDNCSSEYSVPISIDIFSIPEEVTSVDIDSITLCNLEFFNITPDNIITDVNYEWTSPDPEINIFQNQDDNTSFSNLRSGSNTLIIRSNFGECGNYGNDTLIALVIDEIIATDDNYIGAFDNDIIMTPLINDVISTEVELYIINEPQRGELIVENNILTYVPESGHVGAVEYTYEICYIECNEICDQATVTIEIGDDIECFAGNIITPNNDGYNDNFVIPCLSSGNYRQNSLIVFNQWGDEVFSAAPYDNDWDGTYNGQVLPVGTYFYIIDLGDGSQALQGFIIIEL